ncbi:MAG: magnesium transporter [Acidimicrobiia bacterium]|nr:magnesium transporter [Acidimicrobiia bacterium]
MTDLADLVRTTDLAELQQWLAETGTLDIAEELARLDPSSMAVPFRLLTRDRALAVFEALDPYHQQQVLEGLRDDRYHQLVEDMDPDDRARLVGELPAKVARRVLAGLSDEERAKTAALLGYPEESAGRLMTPEYVSLRQSMSVADALAKVRRAGEDVETIYALPVTDDQRHLRGIVSLRQLVLSPPDRVVGDLMTTDVYQVHVTDDREMAARLVQDADVLALPVLDSEERLVGVITVDDAMDVIEAEETEDLALHGGSQPLGRPYLSASVPALARSRALWLLVLIIAAAMTVNVLSFFEETLEAVVTLALFIPLLIDTGGNSGAQASTVVIRAMAVGEVRFSDLPSIIWREARVGLLLGTMLAAAMFVPVTLFFDSDIAIIVSITLVVICTWATFSGSMLPLLAKRVGVDPAVVSAPLITTLVDASGLIIYFLIARAVLDI